MKPRARKTVQQFRKRRPRDRRELPRQKRQLRSTKIEELPLYAYQPLNRESQEIRLIRLLPGKFDDEINLEIIHAPLIEPEPVPDLRPSLREVQYTLPSPWTVAKTDSGDYIFHTYVQHEEPAISQYWHPVQEKEGVFEDWSCPDPLSNFMNPYEALSYCWGTEEPDCLVRVVARDNKPSALYMRPNLFSALQTLRQPKFARVLWIDAISINQNDWDERSYEVRRMSSIYKLADSVIVWLGPGDVEDQTTRAMEMLNSLGSHVVRLGMAGMIGAPGSIPIFRFIEQGPHDGAWYNILFPDLPYIQPYIPYYEEDLVSMRRLLELPWWTRLWIWQEVILPNSSKVTLRLGQSEMAWNNARGGIGLLSTLADRWPKNCTFSRILTPDFLRPRAQLCQARSEFDPTTLIHMTHSAEYTIPHDRIYALLGFLEPEFTKSIQVDYTLPVYQVVRSFCLAIPQTYPSLSFLDLCDLQVKIDKPTWVPNLFTPPRFHAFTLHHSLLVPDVPYSVDGRELLVSGVVYGTIQQVTKPASADANLRSVLKRWESIAKRFLRGAHNETWKTKLIETIQCGEIAENCPRAHGHKKMASCLENYEDEMQTPWVSHCIRGRSLFTCEGANIGICSPLAKKGDIVVMIFGLNNLMILRPLPSKSGDLTYQVVGPTYVAGVIASDVLLGPLPVEVTRRRWFAGGHSLPEFTDHRSGSVTYEDPRLGPLPEGWEFGENFEPGELTRRWFRDTVTGRETWLDPRLSINELQKTGVVVQEMRLV